MTDTELVKRAEALRCVFCGSLWAKDDGFPRWGPICDRCQEYTLDEYGDTGTGDCAFCGATDWLICLSELPHAHDYGFLGCLTDDVDQADLDELGPAHFDEHILGAWACGACFVKDRLGELVPTVAPRQVCFYHEALS